MTYASAFSDDEEDIISEMLKSSDDDQADEAHVLSSDGDAHSYRSDRGSVQSAVNSGNNIAENKKSAETARLDASKAESIHSPHEKAANTLMTDAVFQEGATTMMDQVTDPPLPAEVVSDKMTGTSLPVEAVSDHMPVEEAAEHLELPPEMELSRSGKRTGSGPKDTFYYYQGTN